MKKIKEIIAGLQNSEEFNDLSLILSIYPKKEGENSTDLKKIQLFIIENHLLRSRNDLNKLAKYIQSSITSYIPTIIIGEHDIMCNTEKKKPIINLDKRYRFFDSSIWVRYVSYNKNELGEDSEAQLKRVISEMKKNIDNKIYESNVAKEYIEYNIRLFQNSFLEDLGGHASKITPFIFHSETYMKKGADELLEKFKSAKMKWDLLLVDDFAESELTIGDNKTNDVSFTNEKKGDIIKGLLGDDVFNITMTKSIDEAKEKINGENKNATDATFDVILLDYLFSKDTKTPAYGTDLLANIDSGKIRNGKAFNYKYWIYPVSVFSDALHSSLREKGIQNLEKHWVLGRGADPINTPQLFRYDFLDFIYLQYEGIHYTIKDIIDLWITYPIQDNNDKPIETRYWARQFYHVLWTKFGKAESIIYQSTFSRTANNRIKDLRLKQTVEPAKVFKFLERILHELTFSSIYDFEKAKTNYSILLEAIEPEIKKLDKEVKEAIEIQLDRLGEGIFSIHTD